MKDDKIIRFPNDNDDDDDDELVNHIVLSSVLDNENSNSQSDKDDNEGIDIEVIPPDPNKNYSDQTSSDDDVVDVEFDDAPNPIDGIFSFLAKKMNRYFYMDKNEKRAPKQKAVEAEEPKEQKKKSPSSIEIITEQIVEKNNVYILEDLIRENDLEKLKMLFKDNDKLKNWIKSSYPIHRLPTEVLNIIDEKE